MPAALSTSGRLNTAFSSVGLVILMALVALMLAVAVPVIFSTSCDVESEAVIDTTAEMDTLALAIQRYYRDTDQFPGSLDELLSNGDDVDGWSGPYVNAGFIDIANDTFKHDAWFNEYDYETVDAVTRRITSKGPNQVSGQGDDIAATVSVEEVLEDKNREILEEINTAIANYSALGLGRLRNSWTSVRNDLYNRGMLPNDNDRYLTDPWGNTWLLGPRSSNVEYVYNASH